MSPSQGSTISCFTTRLEHIRTSLIGRTPRAETAAGAAPPAAAALCPRALVCEHPRKERCEAGPCQSTDRRV